MEELLIGQYLVILFIWMRKFQLKLSEILLKFQVMLDKVLKIQDFS
jgi:hypothetical protein